MGFRRLIIAGSFLSIAVSAAASAHAATTILPGPADINRIISTQPEAASPAPPNGSLSIPAAPLATEQVPKNAKHIHFVLRGVVFKHVTAFTEKQLKELYVSYAGKDITLDVVWQIAAELTNKYRQQGYFLSQAFVPAQEVDKGTVKIIAVEGYVGSVSVIGKDGTENSVQRTPLVSQVIDAITADRPARAQTLERQLLLLNDTPGMAFQATLAPQQSQDKDDPAVHLVLTEKRARGTTTLSLDNGGSRYLGPYEVSAAWSGSLLPRQQTDLSVLWVPSIGPSDGDLADGRLFSVNGTQRILLSPATILDITVGYANAIPGYTLRAENVTSQSVNGGIGISYHFLRQREENFAMRLSTDFRDSDTNIMNTVLSRDRIRAVQIGATFDRADSWAGHNYLDVELRQGLGLFGSSKLNDPDLSRPDVHPDFTKLLVNYSRLQGITRDWSSSLVVTGQKASGALYSSEEFGYGGMAIGRAYDTSEISGDDGIAGSLELRYQSVPQWHQITFTPYAFYDIGKVWNLYPSQPEQISGASVGLGISAQYAGFSGNFYVAEPLTKAVNAPLYGGNGKSPRIVFQISDKF